MIAQPVLAEQSVGTVVILMDKWKTDANMVCSLNEIFKCNFLPQIAS